MADGFNSGRNRRRKVTAFKKEIRRGEFCFGLNWQTAIIEVDVIEGLYCTQTYTHNLTHIYTHKLIHREQRRIAENHNSQSCYFHRLGPKHSQLTLIS